MLEARYEALWTAIWWFDDYDLLNSDYAAFESIVIDDDRAINLEFLSNLVQMLYSAVAHGHLAREECDLDARVARLVARLDALATDGDRPSNALWARTLSLALRLSATMLADDRDAVPAIWLEFIGILAGARGLVEFDALRLVGLIEAVAGAAGDDPAYNALVEDIAEFVDEREGEAQAALVLLKRAQQLGFGSRFEMIRMLGEAARRLSKKEHANRLVEATLLLGLAYRSAGLLWAARAIIVFATARTRDQAAASSARNSRSCRPRSLPGPRCRRSRTTRIAGVSGAASAPGGSGVKYDPVRAWMDCRRP